MKFRKKPVVVEAVQYTRSFRWPDWFHDAVSANNVTTYGTGKSASPTGPCFCLIKTLEGTHLCDENDWVIRGVKGELYPCKPDIFETTYEKVEP
jgi:hypothetical protein